MWPLSWLWSEFCWAVREKWSWLFCIWKIMVEKNCRNSTFKFDHVLNTNIQIWQMQGRLMEHLPDTVRRQGFAQIPTRTWSHCFTTGNTMLLLVLVTLLTTRCVKQIIFLAFASCINNLFISKKIYFDRGWFQFWFQVSISKNRGTCQEIVWRKNQQPFFIFFPCRFARAKRKKEN